MKRAATWLAIAVAASLTACAPLRMPEPRNSCALAELEDALGSGGIGGTGILAQDGGIGGTGIVGTITGFGSVCVNGVEVHYDSAVAVTSNGLPSDAAQLAVGQVIAVEVGHAQKGLAAHSIAILGSRPWSFGPGVTRVWLEGIVERHADGDVLVVSGRNIRLTAGTRRAGAAPSPGSRLFVLATVGTDGALVADRIVVPRPVPLRIIAPPAATERRTFEPRFEPRAPAPTPPVPGRMGR